MEQHSIEKQPLKEISPRKEAEPKSPEEMIEDLTAEVEEMEEVSETTEKLGKRFDIPKEEVEEIGEKRGFTKKFSSIKNEISKVASAAIDKIKGVFGKKEVAEKAGAPAEISPEKKEKIKEKIGAAEIRAELFEAISKNPDLPREDLMKMLEQGQTKYQIPEKQAEELMSFIEKYAEKHKAVKEVRKQFTDDKLLFNACFGFLPKGKVESLEGPMSIFFRCKNKKDYDEVLIKQMEMYGGTEYSKYSKTLCELSGAVALSNYSAIPELKETLIIEDVTGKAAMKFKFQTEKTKKHEEQHLLKRLFKEPFLRKEASDKMNMAKSMEEKEALIEPYLRAFKEVTADWGAKDEILANLKEGKSPSKMYSILTKKLGEGGLYDYLEIRKNAMEKDFAQKGISKEKYWPLAKKIFHDEYKVSLKESLGAVEELRQMGKNADEIVAMLITEPLEQWQNFVKDLKNYYNKKAI